MEDGLKDNFICLKNRVWKSYKSRINTAERLKGKHEYIAFLSIYCSAILSAISILNYVNKSNNMNIISIVMSVMITILFLYFEGRNYKERYIKMKENYNELNLLYYKIENYIQLKKYETESYEGFSVEYIKLLCNVENHSEMDYIRYAIKDRDCSIDGICKMRYYLKIFLISLLKVFIFCIPTVILIISIVQLIF